MMPNREVDWRSEQRLRRVHLSIPLGKERKFAFSVEEIDESDYLYL
jgi:hypothetical protein